jgi:hypothetical protein
MRNTFFYLLLIFACSINSFGQTNPTFSVGTIDMLSNGERATGSALSFNKSTECIQLNTGLDVYQGINGIKEFDLTCKTNNSNIKVQFNLFPNPLVDYTRLQSSVLINTNQLLQLTVIDASGRVVLKKQINPSLVFTGASLYFGGLAAGAYYIKIDADVVHQFIPFIKIN